MRKRVQIALAVLLVAMAGVIGWQVVREGEAVYQGKPLKYWFNQLPLTMAGIVNKTNHVVVESGQMTVLPDLKYGSFAEEAEQAQEAIRAIGTNALPFLFAKLTRQEYPLQRNLENRLLGWGLKRHLFANAAAERGQAVTALICLSPLPAQSVRHLQSMSTNADPQIAAAATYVLMHAGAAAPIMKFPQPPL